MLSTSSGQESFSMHTEVTGMEVELCVPEKADADITNAEHLVGKMVAVYRGGCSFQEVTERLIQVGAAGVIIINTYDFLCDVLTIEEGYSAEIPVVMIQAKDAQALLASRNSSCLRDCDAATPWDVSISESNVIGLACDLDQGKLSWSLNGDWSTGVSIDVGKVSICLNLFLMRVVLTLARTNSMILLMFTSEKL